MCIHSGNPCYVQGNIYLFILFIGEDMCFVFLHAGSSMAAQLGAGEFVGANAEVQLSQREKMPLFSLCFCSSLALADDSFQSTFLSVAAPVVSAFLSRCPPPKESLLLRHPFSHHRARRGAKNGFGLVWPKLLWLWYNVSTEEIIWEYPWPPLQCELVYAGGKTAYGSRGRGFGLFPLGILGPDSVDGVVPPAKTFSCQGELAACCSLPWET